MQFGLVAAILLCFAGVSSFAQNLSLRYADASSLEVLQDINDNTHTRVYYLDEQLPDGNFSGTFHSVEQVLTSLFRERPFLAVPYDTVTWFIIPRPGKKTAKPMAGKEKVVTLSGTVSDANTKANLIGATVYIRSLDQGTLTEADGRYEMEISPGRYVLRVAYSGYNEEIKTISITENSTLDFQLFSSTTYLDDVTVSAESKDANVASSKVGRTKIDTKFLKRLPAFLGEADVVRTMTLLPGISTVGEGATGFNVRGGNIDQNLVLLDHAPIYNSSHLFGFFSVFNADVVDDATIYRGGIPSRLGGRISSVLDVSSKTGNAEKLRLNGGIGLVSSRLTLDGPIGSNKTRFIVGGRTSYSDWIVNLVDDPTINQSSARFYDVSANLSHEFNKKNTVFGTFYLSRDRFALPPSSMFNWGTTNFTLAWNHSFSPDLVGSFEAIMADYQYSIEETQPEIAFRSDAGVNNQILKANFSYSGFEGHNIDFGLESTRYRINPGQSEPVGDESQRNPVSLAQETGVESAFYMGDAWKINDKITLEYGLRYSTFQQTGPANFLVYDSEKGPLNIKVEDTLRFSNNEIVENYGGLEPRINLKIGLNRNNSVKASYNRTRQYIHLISNTAAAQPVDIWRLSSRYIRPQIGDQVSMGYFQNFQDNTWETSVELYYKQVDNIIDYRDGATLLLNEFLEAELLRGVGRSYGVEVLIRKKLGALTGWMGYTYSRSLWKVDSDNPDNRINNGQFYPANFDKPHDLTLSSTYAVSRRVNFGVNFTYSTGRPVTAPEAGFSFFNRQVALYSERNQYRIPDYHRLDLSLTVDSRPKKVRNWSSSWTFAIYNVYFRRNAFSVFFQDSTQGPPRAFRLSVLGTAFPSVTYNFKF